MEPNYEYPGFAENFQYCCAESYGRLSYEQTKNHSEYQRASDTCSELYQKIQEQLGENDEWIDKFDAAKNWVQTIESPYIYQQGFQDCIYLLRWLGIL